MNKKTFKQSKTNDKFRGIFPLEFEEKSNTPAIPDKIHIVPIGQWEHDLYGPIIITSSDIREFIQNFNMGIRKGVFITAGHEGFQELPAVGWITEVEARDNGLWGSVEWNREGKELLSDKAFKFFSPEMCRDYEDPETHEYFRNVLTGGALTKSPYFKELEAIVFSESKLKENFNKKITMSKTLDEVLALDISVLTDEDKAVLKENESQLSDEQKVTYATVLEVKKEEETTETEEEKTAREAKEKEDANIAAGLNTDGTPKEVPAPAPTNEEIQASEKSMVKISASELQILREKADKGMEAFAKLEKAELDEEVSKLVFSESNKTGKFLPKGKDTLRAFMETLSKDQRKSFSDLLAQLEVSTKFSEIGAGENNITDGTAKAEVEAKVDAKLKENPKMRYSEALKAVMSENEGLEKRYDEELPSARKSNN